MRRGGVEAFGGGVSLSAGLKVKTGNVGSVLDVEFGGILTMDRWMKVKKEVVGLNLGVTTV